MSRDSRTVTRFSGINTVDSEANVPPHYAIDCKNVVASTGGQLWAARLTKIIRDMSTTAANFARIVSLGVLNTTALNGLPPRLVIQQGGNLAFGDYPAYDIGLVLNVVAPVNPGRLDFVQVAGVLYFASGTWGGKMLPGDPSYYLWGIVQPLLPPTGILGTAIPGVTVQRTGGIVTVTLPAPISGVFANDPLSVDSLGGSGAWPNSFAGLFPIASVGSSSVTYVQAGPDAGPFTRATVDQGLTATTGYQYRFCFGFSKTGHFGTASDVSASTGPLTDVCPSVLSPVPPADPQIDQGAWFRNLDGGGDWYQVGNIVPLPSGGPFPRRVALVDTTSDDLLETSAQTPPYDNGVSPNGKYVMATLDRIVMCGIVGAEDTVRYTGVEAVNFGRPQESWLTFNSISVGQGQSAPIGLGNCRFGTVIFCTNKVMYILNGILSDVTTNQTTALTFNLRELPFKIGLYSHYSIQSTPAGVIFLDDSLQIMIFDGYNPPGPLAPVLQAIMSRITPSSQDVLTSRFVRYLNREWYIICIPVDGSATNNLTLVLDMTQDANRNTGAWVFEYGIDVLQDVLGPDGILTLICAQGQTESMPEANPTGGFLTSLPFFDFQPGDALMPRAHWRSGYFGITDVDGVDEWAYFKLWRFVRLMTEQGLSVTGYFVDGDSYTFDNPYVQSFTADEGVFSANVKFRAVSLDIIIPDDSSGNPVNGFTLNWTFTGKR